MYATFLIGWFSFGTPRAWALTSLFRLSRWPSTLSCNKVPIWLFNSILIVSLILWFLIVLGRLEVARSIIKQHCPQYRWLTRDWPEVLRDWNLVQGLVLKLRAGPSKKVKKKKTTDILDDLPQHVCLFRALARHEKIQYSSRHFFLRCFYDEWSAFSSERLPEFYWNYFTNSLSPFEIIFVKTRQLFLNSSKKWEY